MKFTLKIGLAIAFIFSFAACGNSEKDKDEDIRLEGYSSKAKKENVETGKASGGNDLSNKGIGPIKSMALPESIDAEMANRGADIFKKMCSACHKMDKKFVGPEIAGVTERRSPEWIMNMILNPEEMIKKDPIAKKLLIESNMAVMANQGLEEDEARAIVEYFRQYDKEN
ncbi:MULTISPECIES: c-type cytochrome [Salegentibacter]|uniref:c-type cytochrome n=1 Tax=Salegentibacter TaxID=143222 RepID=UPI00187B58A3|nr:MULTISPECIES: cytochrome c [Salegentibacter]MBE7640546.1 c-type cytochrome [Salegentibacter sp. BLCTC]MBI6115894.1 cytochrome c [Salegentibacter maritimus]